MSSDTNPKTILLRGDPLAGEGAVTGAAVTPGMAVIPAGENVAAAGAGAISPAFARENEIVGKGIDDDYEVGDRCLYYTPRKGDWFYAWVGASETLSAGDDLECAAGGLLTEADAATPVARALEDVTTGAGETSRIKVEVL